MKRVSQPVSNNRRILVIDDNESIQEDFRKILGPSGSQSGDLDVLEAEFFGDGGSKKERPSFDIDCASQGMQGLECLNRSLEVDRPYCVAFVDMRMPPGWDGMETIPQLWKADPRLQIVICTAFSDHSWDDIADQLGETDSLLILKKPFDPAEVRQIACALTEKWKAHRKADIQMAVLNGMVNDRTRQIEDAKQQLEIMYQELDVARKAADSSNRAKSEFLANMSHEIRTPMTAILGYAELISDETENGLDPSERSDALRIILDNGQHLLDLINEILDLSKIESGQLELEMRAVSPATLVGEVVSLMRVRTDAKGLELDYDIAPDVPDVIWSDGNRIRQVLINLIGNAIKFTDTGEISIQVSSIERENAANLSIAIRDSGIGITESQAEKIFEPYAQADSSTTRRFGGTGLGLPLSLRIAKMFGGEIKLESEADRGSTFTFNFPIVEPPEGATLDTPAEAKDARAAGATSEGEQATSAEKTPELPTDLGCKILLAEDTPTNQMLIKRIMVLAGASVEVAENGQIAVDMARQAKDAGAPFDLVLMDMQMPVLDGYQATRKLRELGFDLPIIALTAHAMSGERERCIEAGCDDYATKPIDRPKLLHMIVGHLARTS